MERRITATFGSERRSQGRRFGSPYIPPTGPKSLRRGKRHERFQALGICCPESVAVEERGGGGQVQVRDEGPGYRLEALPAEGSPGGSGTERRIGSWR